jgi:hypothetical protein
MSKKSKLLAFGQQLPNNAKTLVARAQTGLEGARHFLTATKGKRGGAGNLCRCAYPPLTCEPRPTYYLP